MTRVETEYNNCIFALTLAQRGADEGVVNAEMYKALDALVVAASDAGARGFCYNGIPRTEVQKLAMQISDLAVALVTAARSEGVAEGTEQERERIRGESQMVGVDEDCIKFIGSVDNYVGAAFLVPVDVMDPPVLAPTKK